ncbi:MAG TPA: copper amine oxidase N-terminal domain-containing protein [Symbiobacteriaceae bacterium]|nr:copper amine oxidase N-terminal domain-containing protein [Symbiobacteriaceae bacterium]
MRTFLTRTLPVQLTRLLLPLLLCLAVALPATAASTSPFTPTSATLLLEGRLTAGAEPATYSLEGWTLLHSNLDAYVGQSVAVSGTPVAQPNIYMRPTLQVDAIRPLDGSLPPVTLPAFPVLNGPSVQWGRVRAGGAQFWLVTPSASLPLSGPGLQSLVDRPAALRLNEPDGSGSYPVLEAIALDQDLRTVLGQSQIFQRPIPAINVKLWGKPLSLEHPLILGNGRSLAGLRQISETAGAQVTWNDAAKTATFQTGERTVSVTIGSPVARIWDGKEERSYLLDVAPVIVEGRTMLPVRFLAEALGLTVNWEPATSTIDLR